MIHMRVIMQDAKSYSLISHFFHLDLIEEWEYLLSPLSLQVLTLHLRINPLWNNSHKHFILSITPSNRTIYFSACQHNFSFKVKKNERLHFVYFVRKSTSLFLYKKYYFISFLKIKSL
jgi:hypothetical protein